MLGFYPITVDAIAGEGEALQSVSLSGSGGGVAGGSAQLSVGQSQQGSGGGVAGGSATSTQTVIQQGEGGGGGVAGGSAVISTNQPQTETVTGSGGGVGGGSAVIQTSTPQTETVTGSGGAVGGGSAVVSEIEIQTVSIEGSGGAVGGGSAVIIPAPIQTVQTPEIFFILKRNIISFNLESRGPMKTVNEYSSITITLQFTDVAGNSSVPDSVNYQITDEETETVLLPWTTINPANSSYDVDVPDTVQQIVRDGDYEFRTLSVIAFYNAGMQQSTGEFRYRVRNLRSTFQNVRVKPSGGGVANGTGSVQITQGGMTEAD